MRINEGDSLAISKSIFFYYVEIATNLIDTIYVDHLRQIDKRHSK